jgi:hypothetical protein
LRDTILVAGWARSGTTWLAEVLSAAVPQSAILFEPLHAERVPEAAAAGFPFADIPAVGEGTTAQIDFIERVLSGRVLNWWTCSCNPVARSIRPRVWIVKEIRANYLLEWITGTFGIRRTILIIRHPCATIASRMTQGWTPKNAETRIKQSAARRRFPHLDETCATINDPLEAMAARWCLMNYVPLSLRPRPFHVVPYESLATRGTQDLLPIFHEWDIDTSVGLEKSLNRASATTKAGVADGIRHRQSIEGWRSRLTADQTARILRVVRDFGMGFYGDDPEPDYQALHRWSPALPAIANQ